MTSHEVPTDLLAQGIAAFNRGDEAALLAMFDPAVESHVGPDLMNVGTWHGHDGFREMIAAWGEAWDQNETRVVAATTPDSCHVIAEVHQTATGSVSGVPVEMTVFYLLEVRGDKVVRFHIYADRESALAAIPK
jgi:ketosteroid isomerase-like protein